MKKAEYIKKYGTEAYIRKAYRPKYRVAAIRKAKIIVPKPVAVKEQPRGLRIFQADIKKTMRVEGVSFKEAKKEAYISPYWVARRKFMKYPKRVREHIKNVYKEKHHIKTDEVYHERILGEY